jgi:hypothetical protein
MKKLMLLVLVAFSFLASANATRSQGPLPQCNPCDWAR